MRNDEFDSVFPLFALYLLSSALRKDHFRTGVYIISFLFFEIVFIVLGNEWSQLRIREICICTVPMQMCKVGIVAFFLFANYHKILAFSIVSFFFHFRLELCIVGLYIDVMNQCWKNREVVDSIRWV